MEVCAPMVRNANHNYGVTSALDKARKSGLNTYVLTNNPSIDSLDNVIYYNSIFEKEYSFISMGSTFMPMSIMLMYYLGITNENDMNDILWDIYIKSKNEVYQINKNIDVFEILTGDNTYVASSLLTSAISESGIGIPVNFEKYDNYCHGVSNMSYYHPDTTLIYLKNSCSCDLDSKILSVTQPYYKDIIRVLL